MNSLHFLSISYKNNLLLQLNQKKTAVTVSECPSRTSTKPNLTSIFTHVFLKISLGACSVWPKAISFGDRSTINTKHEHEQDLRSFMEEQEIENVNSVLLFFL